MAEGFLDADQLRSATFVRHVELRETLGSTNVRAAELARDPAIVLPALIATRLQTAGKGRGKNQWWSAEGALTFSVLLDSAEFGIAPKCWPQLSLATAVAICDAISAEAPNSSPAIKWPNDVYLQGVKVGGILIESPAGPAPAKDRLIVGIGLNINNSWRAAPRDFGANGIALCDVTGTQHDLPSVLIHVLQAMRNRYQQLAANEPQLPIDWQGLCWLVEQDVDIQSNGYQISGICSGIDVDGTLLVEDQNRMYRIRSGSVRVV